VIFLSRERDPNVIDNKFYGAEPIKRVEELMKRIRTKVKNGEELKLKFRSKWKDTKPQLLKETNGKCAYCESHSSVVAFGDVEHYRPKSVYWWLAYVYDNYLASCQVCNQSWKSNKFEYVGTKMPAPVIPANITNAEISVLAVDSIPDPLQTAQVRKFEIAHNKEKPLNINPYIDDPARYFAWEALPGTREVRLINKPRTRNARKIVDACERIYGLNRPRLVRRRYRAYEIYMGSVLVVNEPAVPANLKLIHQQLINSYMEAEAEYAGMVRFFEAQRASGEALPIPSFV